MAAKVKPPSTKAPPPLIDLALLRRKHLRKVVPYSDRQVDYLEAAGLFPRRISLGRNSVAWREVEVRRWLADRIANGSLVLVGAAATDDDLAAPPPAKPRQQRPGRA